MVDEDGAAKSSSGGGKGMSAEGGNGGCRSGARRTKKLLAGEEGAGGGHTVYLILSRFRGVSVVKLLSASFFADDEDNIFFASMMYSANTLSLLLDSLIFSLHRAQRLLLRHTFYDCRLFKIFTICSEN